MDDITRGMGEEHMQPREEKKCVLCEKVWGVFGLLLGAVFLFIAVDVLTDGKISGLIGGQKDDDA